MATTPRSNLQILNPGESFEVTCANKQCGQKAHLPVPQIETVNQRSYSSYHFSHENLAECEHCGQTYLFVLQPWGKGFTYMPVQEEQGKRIISAPGGDWVKNLKSN